MSKHPSKQNRIVHNDPSDESGKTGHPQKEQRDSNHREGSFRDAQTSVENRRELNEDHGSGAGDDNPRGERRSENEGRNGKS